MMSVAAGWLLGLVLGMRHACEPDHLAAVSTLIAAGPGRGRATMAVGAFWGVGHALALMAPGLVLLWLGGFVFDLETWGGWHAALVATGGSAVALAHIVNLRLSLAIRSCCAAQQTAIV